MIQQHFHFALSRLLGGAMGLVLACLAGAAQGQVPVEAIQEEICSFCAPNCEKVARPQDQVWVVSTRDMGQLNCTQVSSRQMRVMRFDGASGWQTSDLETFFASAAPGQMTIIEVHGNRFTFEESLESGWYVYNALICRAPPTPIRFVIWSWPSEKITRPLLDARVKAQRTNAEGFYLGWFLGQFAPQTPVSLVGYSFGARIITGALHLVGGGILEGRSLPPRQTPPLRVRAALMVAALPNYWLVPGQFHGQAFQAIDRLLVFYNPIDPVLKRYHLIEPLRPKALGSTGAVGLEQLWPGGPAVTQFDVSSIIGPSHDIQRYYDSPFIMSRLQQFLLFISN